MKNDEIILTITMLVSDREDTIEKCMKSLQHLREAVPSELIVVDTAGNQTCMDIVRQYTDNVVPFQWCNDFSAARNAGVEKAQGRWLMYLDDDEWFENTGELEHFFLSGAYRSYFSALYIQRNYSDFTGTKWKDFRAIRLVRREEGTRFVRRVHEQFFPLNSPVCYLNDYVHHYGYVSTSREAKDRHLWRNIRLLLEDRKAYPADPQITAQLIQEYAVAEEHFAAIELCKELWTAEDIWKTVVNAQYATYAMGIELRVYLMQKRYNDGYETAKEMLALSEKRENTVLAKGILCNMMTEFCYRLGKYGEVLEYIDRFYDCKKEWDRYPDPYSLDAFSECAVYVNDSQGTRLALLRMHIYVLMEDWEKAEKTFHEINWQEEDILLMDDTPADVVSLLKRMAYRPEDGSVLKVLYGRKEKRANLYTAIDQLEAQEKEILTAYLYPIEPEDVKMCIYHLMYAGSRGDRETAIRTLEKMEQENYPFFLEDEAYWDSLQKLNVDLNAYMTSYNLYTWMETAKRLWDAVELKICEKAYLCLIVGLEKSDLRYLYLSGLLTEKKLLEKGKVIRQNGAVYSAGEIWMELYQLSQFWVSCAASLYRDSVFMEGLLSAMPPCYQFAWYIMQAGAVKDQDHSLFLRKVADAAKAYPNLKELCKKVIRES